MTSFGCTIEELRTGVVCLSLSGELDSATSYTFDLELRRLEETGPCVVVLDLRELRFMDSTGVARMVAARRRARRGGWRLVLVRGSQPIQRIFRLAAVDEDFEIVNDRGAVTAC